MRVFFAFALFALTTGLLNADQVLVNWIKIQSDQAFGSADRITSMEGCVVRAPEPKSENDRQAFYVLGREVAHCFMGDYHKVDFDWGEWNRKAVAKKPLAACNR